MYKIHEEIDNETEASALQREADSEKEEVAAASCTTSLQCSGGPKYLLRKGKPVTLFLRIQFFEIIEKIFCQFQKLFIHLSVRKQWKESALIYLRK